MKDERLKVGELDNLASSILVLAVGQLVEERPGEGIDLPEWLQEAARLCRECSLKPELREKSASTYEALHSHLLNLDLHLSEGQDVHHLNDFVNVSEVEEELRDLRKRLEL